MIATTVMIIDSWSAGLEGVGEVGYFIRQDGDNNNKKMQRWVVNDIACFCSRIFVIALTC